MKVIIKAIIYLMFINPIIQMGARTKTPTPSLTDFPLQFLETLELAPKIF